MRTLLFFFTVLFSLNTILFSEDFIQESFEQPLIALTEVVADLNFLADRQVFDQHLKSSFDKRPALAIHRKKRQPLFLHSHNQLFIIRYKHLSKQVFCFDRLTFFYQKILPSQTSDEEASNLFLN